jgi:hypothetical protein
VLIRQKNGAIPLVENGAVAGNADRLFWELAQDVPTDNVMK